MIDACTARCADILRAFYRVQRSDHTLPRQRRAVICSPRALLLGLWLAGARSAHAQSPTVLDALSVTVTGTQARGALRLRLGTTATGVAWIASGVVVRPGRRTTAELRTDTLGALRTYTAETRDSLGSVVDRVSVVSAGGRVILERVTPTRRQVREYPSSPGLLIADGDALAPLLVLAARIRKPGGVMVLDVRAPALAGTMVDAAGTAQLQIADIPLAASAWTITGVSSLAGWWTDARGRLLAALLSPGLRLQRDDPPT
jgi:hypothetical protein